MEKKTINKTAIIVIIVFIFIIIFFLSKGGDKPTITQPVAPTPAVKTAPTDSLAMMTTVFQGNHSRAEIKEKIDKALKLYNSEITEENYSRAGSTLVELRRTNGIEEVDILNCMIKGNTPNTKTTFPEMAAMCVTLIVTK